MIVYATPILGDLWAAMGKLYSARNRIDGKNESFDYDTFEEIVGVQTRLQTLLTRLEEKAKLKEGKT